MILATSLFLAAWLGFAGGQAPPQPALTTADPAGLSQRRTMCRE